MGFLSVILTFLGYLLVYASAANHGRFATSPWAGVLANAYDQPGSTPGAPGSGSGSGSGSGGTIPTPVPGLPIPIPIPRPRPPKAQIPGGSTGPSIGGIPAPGAPGGTVGGIR